MWVYLEAGFDDDEVVVRVRNGPQAVRRHVHTDYSIGLAEEIELAVPPGLVDIEIEVPTRDLSHDIRLDTRTTSYLAVSLSPDGRTIEALPRSSPEERF